MSATRGPRKGLWVPCGEPKLEDVAEWLKNDKAGLHFVIILRMPGSPEGLPDREV